MAEFLFYCPVAFSAPSMLDFAAPSRVPSAAPSTAPLAAPTAPPVTPPTVSPTAPPTSPLAVSAKVPVLNKQALILNTKMLFFVFFLQNGRLQAAGIFYFGDSLVDHLIILTCRDFEFRPLRAGEHTDHDTRRCNGGDPFADALGDICLFMLQRTDVALGGGTVDCRRVFQLLLDLSLFRCAR